MGDLFASERICPIRGGVEAHLCKSGTVWKQSSRRKCQMKCARRFSDSVRTLRFERETDVLAESKSAPPGIEITRIVLRLKSWDPLVGQTRAAFFDSVVSHMGSIRLFGCSPENCDRRSDIHCTEKRNRQLLGHPDAPMRCRITGEISRVHSISFMEAHEVTHGRGNKFATARHFHVDVSIGHNRSCHSRPRSSRRCLSNDLPLSRGP